MDKQILREMTERYLASMNCKTVESGPDHLTTKLSIEADKDLLDRPFYWMYVDTLNLEPNPAQLCFIFNPNVHIEPGRGELLTRGSQRFAKMLASAKKRGRFVRLFQEPSQPMPEPYHAWLGINFLVSTICDRKKDQMISLGIHLQSGQIVSSFYEVLKSLIWTSKLPSNHCIASQHLTLPEAISELEYDLQEQIEQQDLTWADQSLARLQTELEQINQFYDDQEHQEEKRKHQQELIWQFHPRVEISVINAGLFHLCESTCSQNQHLLT